MSNKIHQWLSRPGIALFVIFTVTFAAYSGSFQNPFFMDDLGFIVNWDLIKDWKNLPQFFLGYTPPPGQEGIYSPFKTLMHAVNYSLFGLEPFGHHVFAFASYLIAILFIYRIGLLLLKDHFAAFLCALVFALHPTHIEYVSSLTGSVDALGVNFLFISFYLYIVARKGGDRLDRKPYAGSLIFAFLAIYLHELCIILPVMFLWYDLTLAAHGRAYPKIAARTAPYFLLSITYVLAKYLTLGAVTRGRYLYDSFYLTMLVTVKAWAKYVYISLFPKTLTYNHVISPGIYSYDQEDFDRVAVLSQSLLDPQVLLSLLVLGAVAYAAVRCYARKPLVTFCIGWFFIGLLPGANIIPSGVYFAERYLYPGSLGLALLFGHYVNAMAKSGRKIGMLRLLMLSALLIFVVTLCFASRIWARNLDWRSEIAVHESGVRENPASALMRNDLGQIYLKYGLPQKAIDIFQTALAIRKDDPVLYFSMANAYIDLGEDEQGMRWL